MSETSIPSELIQQQLGLLAARLELVETLIFPIVRNMSDPETFETLVQELRNIAQTSTEKYDQQAAAHLLGILEP